MLFWTLNLPETKHWCMFVIRMKTKSFLCGLFCHLPWQRWTLVWLPLNSVTVRTLDDARSLTLWYLGLEHDILMLISYAQKPPLHVPAGVSSANNGLIIFWVFIYIHTLCMRAVKAMARMRICAGSPEPSLLGYMICAKISWACPIVLHLCLVSLCKSSWETHAIRTKIPQKSS